MRLEPVDKGIHYYFTLTGLTAVQMNDSIATTLYGVKDGHVYAGNIPVSATLQYSPDTYGTGKTGTPGILCKALFAYSDSAKAYFAN